MRDLEVATFNEEEAVCFAGPFSEDFLSPDELDLFHMFLNPLHVHWLDFLKYSKASEEANDLL